MSCQKKLFAFSFIFLCTLLVNNNIFCQVLQKISESDSLLLQTTSESKDLTKYKLQRVYRKGTNQNEARPASGNQILEITPNPDEKGASEITMPPIVPPSPNSAILANLISENVDLYTGKTSVNLPIYTLVCNSISLPISLQGSANSHKVNDFGTWVGMGWNLNAGGVISRVMKSLPDEYTGTISSTFNIDGFGFTKIKSLQGINLADFDAASTETKREIIKKGNWNQKNNLPLVGIDLQPDEFFFNFGNYSGKFVFDQDGNINLIPQANFKITPIYQIVSGINKISGFTILTDNGYSYDFGNFSLNAVEETKLTTLSKSILYSYRTLTLPRYPINHLFGIDEIRYVFYERTPYVLGNNITFVGPGAPSAIQNFDEPSLIETDYYPQYPSSWYLTKITAPAGEWISLTYNTNGTISYLSDRSFSASVPDLADLRNPYGDDPNFYTRASFAPPVLRPDLGIAVYPTFGTFTVTHSTIDLVSKKLASITTSQGNTVIFTANTNRNDFPSDKRLDQISIIDNHANPVKRFNLQYEEKYNTDLTEIFKFSYNRTYNKFTSGSTARYDYTDKEFTQETRGEEWAVPPYCRYRMFLASVQEVGATGTTIPAYEFQYDHTNTLPYRTSTEQDKFGFANFNPSRFPFSSSNYSYKYPFYSNATFIAPNPSYGFPSPGLFFQTINAGDNLSFPPINFSGNKDYSLDRLKAGVLKKIIYPTGGFKEFVYEFNGNAAAWNGLRVSEILEKDNITTTPIKKIYTYSPFIQNDDAIQKYVLPESVVSVDPILYSTKKFFFTTNRVNPENATKGGAGCYNWVEVSQPDNGKYRAEFTTPLGYPSLVNTVNLASSIMPNQITDMGYSYPFPIVNNPDWKRGLLKTEFFYKQDAAMPTPILVKSNSYKYDVEAESFGEKNITALNSSMCRIKIYDIVVPSGDEYTWKWSLFSKNSYTSKWFTLASKTERNYAPDGVAYIENTEDYTYNKYAVNNKDYLYLTQTKNSFNSRDEQTIKKTKPLASYFSNLPATYTGTNLFMSGLMKLKSKNILNAPIEDYTYKQDESGSNRKYIDGTLNRYGSPVSVTDIFKLKKNPANTFTESTVSGSSFSYDANYNLEASFIRTNTGLTDGLISSQKKVNGVEEHYKWDYERMYPIAKIISATGTDDDISYTSFETNDPPDEGAYSFHLQGATVPGQGVTGEKVYQLTPANSITRPIHNNIPYTVSLWAKNGTVTVNGSAPVITGRSVNGYQYQEWQVNDVSSITIASSSALLDELRLYPKDALMTTYTYNPLVGMTAECGPSNNIQYYKYDDLQRLKTIRDQDGNILKQIDYQYQIYGHSSPVWQATGVLRCKPCPSSPAYPSAMQQHEEKDVNSNSPSYNSVKWEDDNITGDCTNLSVWQNTSTPPSCEVNSSTGYNTGFQLREQKDVNPCSPLYNTLRMVQGSLNTLLCPPPAQISGSPNFSCSGSSPTSGSGAITAPAGYNVSVLISANGSTSGYSLSVTISGGGLNLTQDIADGSATFSFVMPASGSVNWNASMHCANGIFGVGRITVY